MRQLQTLVGVIWVTSSLSDNSHNSGTIVVPRRHSLSTYGRQAFAFVGPAAWNSLSDKLHDPAFSTDTLRRLQKTHLFSEY